MQNQNAYSITFKGGKLLLAIGGLPLIFGFLMISSALLSLIIDDAIAWDSFFAGLIVGSVICGIGLVLVSLRPTVLVDRSKLAVIEYWHFAGIRFGYKETRFAPEHWVSLTSELQVTQKLDPTDRGKREQYIVFSLCIEDSTRTIPLVKPGFYLKAVKEAENIAKYLNCDLKDRSGKEEVIRKADQLDISLREQVRQEETPGEMPAPPRATGCTWTWDQGVLEVINPPIPLRIYEFKKWLNSGLVIMVPVIVYRLGTQELMPKLDQQLHLPFKAGFWVIWSFLTVALIYRQISKALTRQTITVGDGQLQVGRRGLLKTTNVGSMPLSELEELTLDAPRPDNQPWYLGDDQTLMARSDKKVLHLGAGLSGEELQWLRDAIRFVVAR